MKQIRGRDLVLDLLEGFERCYPATDKVYTRTVAATPECGVSGRARCSGRTTLVKDKRKIAPGGAIYGTGCIPKNVYGSEKKQGLGEYFMPLVLDIIDGITVRENLYPAAAPEFSDGIDYAFFRKYIEWNYLQPWVQTGTQKFHSSDSEGFRIKSFGAHYHKIDMSARKDIVLSLERHDDLPRWAFAVFTKKPCINMVCVEPMKGLINEASSETSGWSTRRRASLTIPYSLLASEVFLIVTAFEGVYSGGESYNSEYGHYSLATRPVGGTLRAPLKR